MHCKKYRKGVRHNPGLEKYFDVGRDSEVQMNQSSIL